MEVFQTIWESLTTYNEGLINFLYIPLSFIEATVTMLLFTTILSIVTTRKQKILYAVILSLISIISRFFIPDPYNVFFNMITLPICVILIFKTNILKGIFAEILPIMIGVVIETILLKIYYVFGIAQNEAYTIPVYRITFAFSNYIILYLLYMLSKRYNFNVTLVDTMDRKTKILLIINSLIMIISVGAQTYLTTFYIDNLPIFITFISILSLISYYAISIYSLTRITKLELTTKDLEQTKEYNRTLGILHDSIRCFKHDFNNIVTTIGGYVQSEDMKGLKKYYSQLRGDCERINNLTTLSPEVINNPAIYSLLTNKYHLAEEKGSIMNLDVFLDLNELNMKIYEFTRILGILLDNAIEASSECNDKIINIVIRKDTKVSRQLLIIENTYKNIDVDTEKIFEKGYSSKPNNTGLGLWEVRQIMKKNNNLNLYTSKNDIYFKQQLEIYI